jgi:tRNA G10  N-methylase Trm11
MTIYSGSDKTSEKQSFLFVLSLGTASLLEISSTIETLALDASIETSDSSTAVVTCSERDARSLIKRLGTCYKVSRILGGDLKTALESADLPYQDKFCWTVSGYRCSYEDYLETRHELHDFLKARKMGKSKFLEPNLELSDSRDSQSVKAIELKISDLVLRIITKDPAERGIDFIVCGGTPHSREVFAQTIEVSDPSGYDKRDFGRPFQDPRKTLSPRIARLLVNLSSRHGTRTLLDPFCGLGTILQEALMCKLSVIGVDRDQRIVAQAKSNLEWLRSEYGIGDKIHTNLFAYDARRISRARMPRLDAIASEPILLPILEKNPSVEIAKQLMEKARDAYVRALAEMATVINEKNDKIALTIPALVDASGKERHLDLLGEASDFGLRPYLGNFRSAREISYPLRMDSQKRKIVNRCLDVFYKS